MLYLVLRSSREGTREENQESRKKETKNGPCRKKNVYSGLEHNRQAVNDLLTLSIQFRPRRPSWGEPDIVSTVPTPMHPEFEDYF